MPSCHHVAPNGKPSLLYQQLEQKYGPDKAHDYWTQVYSQQFQNRWGKWQSDGFSRFPLDENKEPTLAVTEEKLKIKPPFKAANAEQTHAIAAIQDFIERGSPSEFFTLEGKAGTGKTTLIQEALAPFIERGERVLVMALAHKAKLVLANKLTERFGARTVASNTIAGGLAMGMDVETGKFSTEFGNAYVEKPIESANIIVVDEASMVNEEALGLIMSEKMPGAKVIFLGDIGQLPPIREGKGAGADLASPTFTTNNKAKLLERVRQGEESPILPYADKYWNNSQSKSPVLNPAGEDDRKSLVTEKGSLVFAKFGSVMNDVLPLYKEAVETGNPDKVKTVVYRNDTRNMINARVREFLFGKEAPQFVTGDLLMFQDNYTVGREKISNSTEIQVMDARKSTTEDGWAIWRIGFSLDGVPMDIPVLDKSEVDRFKQHLDKLGNEAKAMPKGQARTAKWRDFWKEKARFAPVDYSYAITSHKSQGSTYDVVLVGEADIMAVSATTNKSKSQSIYTAITRARHIAVVMDGKHDDPWAMPAALDMMKKAAFPDPTKVEPPVSAEKPTEGPAPVPEQPTPALAPAEEKERVTFDIGTKRLTEEQFEKKVDAFYEQARQNPGKTYHVPVYYLSEKHRYSNGLFAQAMANIFDRDDIPDNVEFTGEFREKILNTNRRIRAGFGGDNIPVEFISVDEPQVLQTAARMLIRKVNEKGEPDGFFSPEQQKEIIDSVVLGTERSLRKDPALGANAMLHVFRGFWGAQQRLINAGDTARATLFTSIHEARVQIATEALKQLDGLGLVTDEKTVQRILNAINNLTPLSEQEKAAFRETNPDVDIDNQDVFTGEFLESVGRIARDWSDNTFELDPRDTASARIKLFMGTLYDMDKGIYTVKEDGVNVESLGINLKGIEQNRSDMVALAKKVSRKGLWYKDQANSEKLAQLLQQNVPHFPKENFLGIGRTADYNEIFKETLNQLGNRPQSATFEEFMAILDAHPNPTINEMAGQLKQEDQSMKNEFMSVMMKQFQPFTMALFNVAYDNGRPYYVLQSIDANRYSQRQTLVRYWKEQQKLSEIMIETPSGEKVIDVKRIRENWIPILKYFQGIKEWNEEEHKPRFIKLMGGILNLMGVGVTPEMLSELYDRPGRYTKDNSLTGLFATNGIGQATGAFSIFIEKAAGLVADLDISSDEADALKLSELNNPLYTEGKTMQGLATLAAKFTPVIYSSNHRNSEGKSVWDWGLNTKLSHQFRQFKGSFDEFARITSQTHISADNWLVDYFQNTRRQLEDVELSYFDGLKAKGKKRGSNRAGLSDREQLLSSILLFQNQGNGFNTESKVNYMSLTHGDKTMTPIFKNMPRLNMGGYGKIPAKILGTMNAALYNVFKAEYTRIVGQAGVDSGNHQYEAGKGLFYFIPEFNYDSMKQMVAEGFLSEKEFNAIWPAGQRTLTQTLSSDNELPVINKILTRFVNNLVLNTLNTWKKNGLVTENFHVFDNKYTNQILKLNGISVTAKEGRSIEDKDGLTYKDAQGKELTLEQVTTIVAATAAKDYAINSFLFNTSLSQLFYGDPAESFKKSKKGNSDIDHVISTMKEYTKRLAKDIAPRADLYWPVDKRTYNSITMADVHTNESYLSGVTELAKAYGDVNATDAQELITVQEHLDCLFAAGKISSSTYAEMSTIVAKGGDYAFTNPDHLKVIMQPQKPLYAGMREPVNGARLSDYVKSSAYPLYPPLTKGREIDKLRVMMESNNIQRAAYESARKLGGPLQPVQVFSPQGIFSADPEKVRGGIQTLSRDGFGIQQEVPYDPDKDAIKTLTQMNENITEGIQELKDFDMPGYGNMDGKQVRALREEVRKEMIHLHLQEFLSRLNVGQDGRVDIYTITEELTNAAKRDTRGSYTLNEIQSLLIRNEDGTPKLSLMFNTAADKFESLLMGMVNKISEIKMPGKSYVQAAGIGMNYTRGGEEDLKKTIRVGNWDGSPLKTLRPDPANPGKTLPAQVILPFNFFDHEGNKLNVEDFLKEDGSLDMDRIPQELLQIVAGRVPNQKHSSILPMEIVGFVPSNMGDVAFVPAAITTQMGADFDVDKLYTYHRPYDYQRYEAGENGETKPLEKHKLRPVSPVLEEAGKPRYRGMEELQRQYFDLHWAILTHPDMLTRVLAPLDKKDLLDESELLAKKTGGYYNFYDPMTQMEDFQTGKEAKKLVGSSSWAVKMNARIQQLNLRYGTIDFNNPETPYKDQFLTVIDEHTGKERPLGRLSGTGTSYYTKKDGEPLTADNRKEASRSKADNHVLVQSEAVDNMKNRTLDPLNLTPDTYKAVQALIQLETNDGWAANSKYWTRLLTQPVIWEYTRAMKQGNDSLSDAFNPDLHNTVVQTLIANQVAAINPEGLSDEQIAKLDSIVFSPQLLLEAQSKTGEDFHLHQMAALRLFSRLYDIGQRMFELEALLNQDVSGAGKDLFTVMDKASKMSSLESLPILGATELVTQKGEPTEVGYTFRATNGVAMNVIGQVLPYTSLKATFNKLLEWTGKPSLTIDNQKAVLRAFRSSAYTSGNEFWKDPQADRVRLFYGANSLARRLAIAQRSWGATNPMLSRLSTKLASNVSSPDYIEYNAASKATAVDRQNMSTGWLDLLLSKDPDTKLLGEDLLRYALLTGGIQDANSFVEFLPTAYLTNTGLVATLQDIETRLKSGDAYLNEGFLTQFIQHNPEMAFQVSKEAFGELPKGREYPETFIPKEAYNRPYLSFYSRSEGKWILYAHNRTGETDFYTRIDTLGNEFTDEYNGSVEAGQRSIFSSNRALTSMIPSPVLKGITEIKNNAFGTEDFNKNVNVYDQIGVKPGGRYQALQALASIEDNPHLYQHLRTVAKFLRTTNNSQEFEVAKQMIGPIPFKIEFTNNPKEGPGAMGFDNTLTINPSKAGTPNGAATVFLHEMTHGRLQWMVVATGNDPRVMPNLSAADRPTLQRFIDDYRKRFPEVVKHMATLDKLRYQALNAFRNRVGEERFQQIAKDSDNRQHPTGDHLIYYGLHSLQEFVAHVPTSKVVANFLNELQADEKYGNLLERIWNILAEMLAAVGKTLGISVREGSVLKESLVNVLSLMDMNSSKALNLDITQALMSNGTIEVPTQQQAEDLRDMTETTYERKVRLQNTGHNWLVGITNEYVKTKRTSVPGQRGRILERLYEQKDEVSNAISREKDIHQRVQLEARRKEIWEQIHSIKQSNDIQKIYQIGKRQLEWVDSVLKSASPTAVDITLAMNTTHLWKNLIDILYGGLEKVTEVSNDFRNLQTEAQIKEIELFGNKARKVVADRVAGDTVLTPMDFREKLQDLDIISANTLSLTRAKSKLVQATAALGWREANNRDEHIFKITQKLQALEKKMKTAGLTTDMMIQYSEEAGTWGMVNRLSSEWFSYTTDKREKLDELLNALDSAEVYTDEQRREKKKEAWNTYWADIRKVAVFVDTRYLLDTETGSKKSGPGAEKAFSKLAEAVGSETYAKELLDTAQERYKNYLVEKEIYLNWLDSRTNLTEEEAQGKSKEETDKLLAAKKDALFRKWLEYNSPVDMLERLDKGKHPNLNSDADRWIVMTPHKKHTRYFDEKYQKLEADPRKKEAYNEYRQILQEMISYLPVEVQRNLPENFLPIVPKDTAGFLATVFDKIRNWDTEMMKALAATDQEEALRLRPDKIPVMYTEGRGQTREIANRSTDVIRVLELFSMMALQHKYMGNVLDMINISENVLKEVNRRRAEGLEEGKPLKNVMDALKYFKDMLVFKKPKELEARIDMPVYSMNIAKQYAAQKEVQELNQRKKEIESKIYDEIEKGNFETPELDAELKAVEKKLDDYDKDARYIYGSKVVDTLISINQMKSLGFNPFSAASNFSFGLVSLFIHARGRVDLSPKEMKEAWGVMAHSMQKYWMFSEVGDPVAQKVHALMNRAGIMGDIVDTSYGKSNLKTHRKGEIPEALKPFNWQRSGDYFVKGIMMVAMMKKKTVEVTDRQTGEKRTISLWDAFDSEGKWDSEKYLDAPEWYSDEIHDQADWNRYRDKMRKVGMLIFGNQDKNSPLMAKKTWLLRLAGQFRLSWLPEGIATRWKPEYEDINLGRKVKGRWRTYGSLGIMGSGLVLARQMLASLPGVNLNPFEGVNIGKGNDRKPMMESEVDMENMRKNFAGLAWTVGVGIAILMLKSLGDDDHKKDNEARRRQLLINLLIRTQQDLMLYSSPSVFNTISGNFLPATQVLVDYWKAMEATGHYLVGDTSEDKHAFNTWIKKLTRAGIPHPTATLYNKIETMMTRDLDKLQR